MAKAALNTRVTTLEGTMKELAKAQVKLTNTMNHLAEVQADQAQRITEIHVEQAKRDKERDAALDKRIGKLVSAIGELISRMPVNGGKE